MSDCIECTRYKCKGYGQVRINGKRVGEHRVVFFEANGYWPEVVRHTCDNPSCINLAHLVAGTVGDNNRDKHSRGRAPNHITTLNQGMPSKKIDGPAAYMREQRRRQASGEWVYRAEL